MDELQPLEPKDVDRVLEEVHPITTLPLPILTSSERGIARVVAGDFPAL